MKEKQLSEVIKITMDSILEPAEAVRTSITLERLEELSRSIREVGLIQPINVKAHGDKYEIVAGHRRYLASQMVGLVTINAIVLNENTVDCEQLKLHENFFREDISPIDEGRYFIKMKEKMGWNQNEVAKYVNRPVSYVATRMNLLAGCEMVLAALEGGHISVSQAKELNCAENDDIRKELLRIAVENGASVNSLRIMRQDYENRVAGVMQTDSVEIPNALPTEPVRYKIHCPCCDSDHELNNIYPVSVCKQCHYGLLEGFKEALAANDSK